ncbi:hypothetical protein HKD21_01240 [Gluconobacter cerevisiae]|uniref:Uncharacterized protein n=1 Tax=Gluconobacter cerevisiae TaxID=1379734 RepID=A0ABR9YA03_9PROT|nr:hypothetical protein [Gluconobacter cerevisiae]MBF0875474.1 hypothetical protein [Gluconobacter cerevisiae]
MVKNEVVSAIKNSLRSWVCRKDVSSHPALLTDSDFQALAVATTEGMAETPSLEGVREWGSLKELTKNWIVHQRPHVEPGPLGTSDFEHLAALTTAALSEEQSSSASVSHEPLQNSSEACLLPHSDADFRLHDPTQLVFAREHLERCL